MAKADGSFKELMKMEKQDLLILDDFAIQPPETQSRTVLIDIIEGRHGKQYSHQMPTTEAETINKDILEFIQQ